MRKKILAKALQMMEVNPHWAALDLKELTKKAGLSEGELGLIFPHDILDIAVFYLKMGDLELAQSSLAARESRREKIAHLIWQRLSIDGRKMAKQTASFFSQPLNLAAGAKALFATSDAIWLAAGDSSTDFSYYTKRATLAAVYSAAILFYISPLGKSDEKVQHFIKREINLLLKIMGAKNSNKASQKESA